jgi:hypothetical protein
MPSRRSSVYSIPCDCGRCYICETRRPVEVCNKEHNMHMRRPQNMLERREGLADWAQHHIQEIQGISPRVSAGPSDQSAQFGYLSHLDPRYHSRSKKKKKTATPSNVDWVGKFVFLALVP